jgi:hypothetical protein
VRTYTDEDVAQLVAVFHQVDCCCPECGGPPPADFEVYYHGLAIAALDALATAGRLRPPKGIVKTCPFCDRKIGLHGNRFAYHLGRSGEWACSGGGAVPA